MADVSVIEIVVYGLICYTGMIGLIVSAFRHAPAEKDQSLTRVVWLIPSIFAAFMLASAGADVYLDDSTVTNTIVDVNSTQVWTESITTVNKITLLQPVWVTLHILFFIVMLLYVMINVAAMFTKIR